MKEIRVHARAGQGAITVDNLLGDAAFREKKYAVAFPTFGAARMGAPMNAFIRIDAKPIRARSQIHHPDYIIVMDPTLLQGFNVFEGLKEGGVALISADPEKIKPEGAPAGSKVILVPANEIAREIIGKPFGNTALLGAFSAASGQVSLDAVLEAINHRFPKALAEKNVASARRGYDYVKEKA